MVLSPAPRTLEPDRFSVFYPDRLRNAIIETVNQKFVISDGTRTLDVYVVPPFDHNATMVFAYMTQERIVVSADMYRPPDEGAPLPRPVPDRLFPDSRVSDFCHADSPGLLPVYL